MTKAPPASERMPSQRGSREERRESTQLSELIIMHANAQKERDEAIRDRKAAEVREKRLQVELEALQAEEPCGECEESAEPEEVKEIKSNSAFDRHAVKFGNFFACYPAKHLPSLVLSGMKKAAKKTGHDVRGHIAKSKFFKPALDSIHALRDAKIAKHLSERVFTSAKCALLRLIVKNSKRECGLIQQTFKYEHLPNGRRVREKLCEGSAFPAPELFSIEGITAVEKQALNASGVKLREHSDKRGADISGERYSLDTAIFNGIEAAKTNRTGGMATKGTQDDPHIECMTGDGAGLSAAFTGVAVRSFNGSTNGLNQSSLDVINWLLYKESRKAEDYMTLKGRLRGLQPDLRRLYNGGKAAELRQGGRRSGVYIKLVLTADKPFIRHVCGMLSHNADAFGSPYCRCKDKDLFNFSRCKRTHYGSITFETLCARAHVPVWMALEQDEPDDWVMTCDCCDQVTLTNLLHSSSYPPKHQKIITAQTRALITFSALIY